MLMNVLEGCIIFLIWPAWVLIFILSKNKGFQSGTLLKMSPSFVSTEGIWSRYSQINKFKISKDVFFQITKTI